MDAPTFPPARFFKQPERLPYPPSVGGSSVVELRKDRAVWKVIVGEMPQINFIVGNPQMAPYLEELSLSTMAQFGMVPHAVLARIDTKLKALGGVR